MSEPLSAADVRRVARLARLRLNDDEVAVYARQLGQVLEYVNQLQQVDTTQVVPMAHAIELQNVFREDQPTPSLSREAALANAPQTDGTYFLVPAILDSE